MHVIYACEFVYILTYRICNCVFMRGFDRGGLGITYSQVRSGMCMLVEVGVLEETSKQLTCTQT